MVAKFGGHFNDLVKSLADLKGFRDSTLPIVKADIDPEAQGHIARWMYAGEWPYIEDFGYSKKESPASKTFDQLTNSYGLQKPTTLFRGIGDSEPNLKALQDRLNSFTADPRLAKKYYSGGYDDAGNPTPGNVLVYSAPRGSPGLPLRLNRSKGEFQNQDEVIMPRGLNWDLSGDPTKIGGINYFPVNPTKVPNVKEGLLPAPKPWDLEAALKRFYGEEDAE